MSAENVQTWFAGLHPFFVHFPIALLVVIALAEVLLSRRRDNFYYQLSLVALLLVGFAASLAAVSGHNLAQLGSLEFGELGSHSQLAFIALRLLLLCIVLKALLDAGRRHRLYRMFHLEIPRRWLSLRWLRLKQVLAAPVWRRWWLRLLLLPLLVLWWLLKVLSWPLRAVLRYPGRILWRHRSWQLAYLFVLVSTTVVVVAAGFRGARLTHGEDHTLLPSFSSTIADTESAVVASRGQPQAHYHRRIKPQFDDYCARCHGPVKQKGQLRMDDRDSLLATREELPAIAPGDAMGSDVVRRLLLPRDHNDAMPPAGEEQPPPTMLLSVVEWITQGAIFGPPPPLPGPQPEVLLGEAMTAPDPRTIQALRSQGLIIARLSEQSPLLRVNFAQVAAENLGGLWQQLQPLAQQIVWLDLSGHAVPSALMFQIGEISQLTRLSLRGCELGEGDVLALSGLLQLRRLNLLDTGLAEAHIAGLDLPALEHLYLSRGLARR